MGLIRVLLAIAVVLSHNVYFLGFESVGSILAVEVFFMISGFYMALILATKYSFKQYYIFLSNRFLRLLPLYWAVLILMVLCSIIWSMFSEQGGYLFFNSFVESNDNLSVIALIGIIFSNISLVFIDVLLFLKSTAINGIEFSASLSDKNSLSNYILVGPAWTLGLEIMFYIIIPFIIFIPKKVLFVIAIILLIWKYFFILNGFNYSPWTYRFFPFELGYFLLGVVAYHLHLFFKRTNIFNGFDLYKFVLVFGFLLFAQFIPFSDELKRTLILGILLLTMGGIFNYFKNSKLDRYIGEFSYPIYISHVFVITIIGIIFSKLNIEINENFKGLIILLSTFVFSYLLIKLVSNPIEKLRQSRVRTKKA